MRQALRRLFLILFPISLFLLALFFIDQESQRRNKIQPFTPKTEFGKFSFLSSDCPFYLGVSFFPIEDKKQKLSISQKSFQIPLLKDYFLSEKQFKKKLKTFKIIFREENLSLKNTLFVFPLVLTKDNEWLIGREAFFILPTGERKELSHINYSEAGGLYKSFTRENDQLLKLSDVFSYLPDSNFLFHLKGSNREKIIKNIKNFKDKTKGEIYLSSFNERLLEEVIALDSNWNVLHSFKKLMRFQIMNAFYLADFQNLFGRGFVIPSSFPLSTKSLLFLQSKRKLLFVEKDPPYGSVGQSFIQNVQALISSQPKQALSIVKAKKPCLVGK